MLSFINISTRNLFLIAFFLLPVNINAVTAPEYTLKATFLYNFTMFTTWPNTNKETRSICILGDNPFENDLHKLVETNQKQNHIKIEFKHEINETTDCDILFISRSEKNLLDTILVFLKDKPILTVSDIKNFAHKNGMIEFHIQSSKIKLKINLVAVNQGGIKLHSNLIELGTIIKTKE